MPDVQGEHLADIVEERKRAHNVDNLMDLVRVMYSQTGEDFNHTTLRMWADRGKSPKPQLAKMQQFARGTSGPGINGQGPRQSYEDVLRRLKAATGRPLPAENIEINPRFANLRASKKRFLNDLITQLDVEENEVWEEALERARAEVRSQPLHAVPDDGDGGGANSGAG